MRLLLRIAERRSLNSRSRSESPNLYNCPSIPWTIYIAWAVLIYGQSVWVDARNRYCIYIYIYTYVWHRRARSWPTSQVTIVCTFPVNLFASTRFNEGVVTRSRRSQRTFRSSANFRVPISSYYA